MTREQARSLQRELLRAYTKAVDLELALRSDGRSAEAASVARRADVLRRQIDALRLRGWRSWRGRAARIQDEMRNNNRKLQDAIRAVGRSLETASDVVEALAYIEAAIGTAARIAGRS